MENRALTHPLESLQERERMLRLTLENAPIGIVTSAVDGHYLSVNPAFCQMMGYSAEELLQMSVLDLVHPDDRARTWEQRQALIRGETGAYEAEKRYIRKDGEEITACIRVGLVMDDAGAPLLTVAEIQDVTARRLAEQKLRDSEEQLRLTVENAPVGILTVEPERRIRSVNPHLCELLGYSADELVGMDFNELLFPDDRKRGDPLADELLAGSIPQFDIEVRLLRKDGALITGEFHVNLVRDPDGEPQFFVGQLQDITARKEAEEQQQRREELLRLTFDNAPIGMAIADPNRRIIRANPAMARMLGYTRAELESMAALDITHPDDRRATHNNLQRLWDGDKDSYREEKRYVCKDGRMVTCLSHVSIVRDESGVPLMTIGQVQDITERMEAVREMQRMRTYLKNIIDSMPSMLVAVDQDGRVTQWNAAAEQTTGVSAQQAMGQQVTDFLPIDEIQVEQIKKVITSGKPVKAERLPIDLTGETRFVDALAYPLIADGTVGAVIRLDDVTDRVRMQEMMVQTEKMLSVGGLAAGMAHEINNPLGAILQSCQNIQRRFSGELPANRKAAAELDLDLDRVHQYLEQRNILQFLQRIQEAGTRAAKIVNDMLTFSRRSELHYEPIDLAELLDTSVRLASSDYDLKKEYDIKLVEFRRDFDPDLGLLECDKTEIEQVILNLIVNAAQAMAMNPAQEKPPRITLRTRLEGDYARIEVMDNGPGMNEQTRRRIFEPFYTTKEVGVGTGLGLSVSYFIIYDQHKGSMQVETAPGEGARFIIRLPLRQS
ncbi:MAG: PAS domain S-box protein [Gammaproteobacteria bacterium]|nr:PAS domain S-box protein [Gammaproteobacteria bacterium]